MRAGERVEEKNLTASHSTRRCTTAAFFNTTIGIDNRGRRYRHMWPLVVGVLAKVYSFLAELFVVDA